MNMVPKISVIVPVYNAEQYLPKCIDSILSQTFTDFELLLIDDGSPDRCGEICDGYAKEDERIHVFHQKNAGVSAARNRGLEEMQGEYVAFVDSDDYVTSDYLQSLYDMLPTDVGLEGLVIGGLYKVTPDGACLEIHVPNSEILPTDYASVLTDLVGENVMYPYAKLYDNRLIQKNNVRFVSQVSCGEDMLFMLDYLLYSNFLIIRDVPNYMYRVGYSMNTLSTCIKDFNSEYAAFSNFQDRVYNYQKMHGIKDEALGKVWHSQTIFFHKIILAIYKASNCYTYKERLAFLNLLLSSPYRCWIKKFFAPQYKADCVAKFLLVTVGAVAFDVWMQLLLTIDFKFMFGGKR